MKENLRKSGQLFNCKDNYEAILSIFVAKEARKINETTQTDKASAATRVIDRKIQKMWQAQLQMCQRASTRTSLLSVGEHAWNKTNSNVCSSRIESIDQKGFITLSENTTPYRKNQRYQPRIIETTNVYLEKQLRYLQWQPLPLPLKSLSASLICFKII